MKNRKIVTAKINLLLLGLCISALIAVCTPLSVAQGSASDPAHSYCVRMGYLYKTSPSLNGGHGVCEFPDKSWCDALNFYAGTCGPRLSPHPGVYYGPANEGSVSASKLCRENGGTLQQVHTPYGDVLLCVFPNGKTCDVKSLLNGMCNGDNWLRYARSWLDAP